MRKVYVLRWGHRPRDYRLTSHICLTARAFGANGLFLTDVTDNTLKNTIYKIISHWGGKFDFQMGMPWRSVIDEWKKKAGTVVHLTMYGQNINNPPVMDEIDHLASDILILVGSQKVPKSFYAPQISDYNIAVGNQPHSEVAALAIFLDRLFKGKELSYLFKDAQITISPSDRGKNIVNTK
ncbi:hypothetical protein [[Eubacterium] cellulosolvens]